MMVSNFVYMHCELRCQSQMVPEYSIVGKYLRREHDVIQLMLHEQYNYISYVYIVFR
jgi:hypothetical protein